MMGLIQDCIVECRKNCIILIVDIAFETVFPIKDEKMVVCNDNTCLLRPFSGFIEEALCEKRTFCTFAGIGIGGYLMKESKRPFILQIGKRTALC